MFEHLMAGLVTCIVLVLGMVFFALCVGLPHALENKRKREAGTPDLAAEAKNTVWLYTCDALMYVVASAGFMLVAAAAVVTAFFSK